MDWKWEEWSKGGREGHIVGEEDNMRYNQYDRNKSKLIDSHIEDIYVCKWFDIVIIQFCVFPTLVI